MEISWLGESALLLKGRGVKVLLDPAFKGAAAPQESELVVAAEAGENRLGSGVQPQVVGRPGEYEIRGVGVTGTVSGGVPVFAAEVDEVNVCELVRLPSELDPDVLEALGSVDVLAVSLEGGTAPRAREVANLVAQVQPPILIPIGYRPGADGSPGELASLVQEMGLGQVTAQAKLSLSGAPAETDETRVVVLEPRR